MASGPVVLLASAGGIAGGGDPVLDGVDLMKLGAALGPVASIGMEAQHQYALKADTLSHALALAGDDATPIVWALALEAATTRQELMLWQTRAAGFLLEPNAPTRQAERAARLVATLRRNYASTVKTLAEVRRVETATLIRIGQVNITSGPQQVVNAPASTPKPAQDIEASPKRKGSSMAASYRSSGDDVLQA